MRAPGRRRGRPLIHSAGYLAVSAVIALVVFEKLGRRTAAHGVDQSRPGVGDRAGGDERRDAGDGAEDRRKARTSDRTTDRPRTIGTSYLAIASMTGDHMKTFAALISPRDRPAAERPCPASGAHATAGAEAIQVAPGYKPFLAGHAIGTQGYVCVAVGSAFRLDAVRAAGHAVQRGQRADPDAFPQPDAVQPAAQSHVAALSRLERRLGPDDQIVVRSELRGARCDSRGCCSTPRSSGTAPRAATSCLPTRFIQRVDPWNTEGVPATNTAGRLLPAVEAFGQLE